MICMFFKKEFKKKKRLRISKKLIFYLADTSVENLETSVKRTTTQLFSDLGASTEMQASSRMESKISLRNFIFLNKTSKKYNFFMKEKAVPSIPFAYLRMVKRLLADFRIKFTNIMSPLMMNLIMKLM